MITRLKLKNYRQHTDREFTFKDGLVVLRGANEAGKTTIIEALMYLWFGAKALSQKISEVVTYDENEKSLRVEGSFTINGVQHEAYRSPTGAEIVCGDRRITGQTDTALYMESLLGAKADVVKKLMIAEQNSVRGILDSETDAGALIEALADLDVIDNLIDKIKNQLPSGPTKGAEAALQSLQSAVYELPEAPTTEAVEAAKVKHDEALAEVQKQNDAFEQAKTFNEEGLAVLKTAQAVQVSRDSALKLKAQLESVQHPGDAPYTDKQVEDAKRLEQDSKLAAEIERHRKAVIHKSSRTFAGTYEAAQEAFTKLKATIADHTAKIADLRVKYTAKAALRINEGECSFCKKDISALPEVATKNAEVDAELAAITAEGEKLKVELAAYKVDAAAFEEIFAAHTKNLSLNPAYWEPVAGQVPSEFRWIGPEAAVIGQATVSSAAMLDANRRHSEKVWAYEKAQRDLAALEIPESVSEGMIAIAKGKVEAFTAVKSLLDKASMEAALAATAAAHAQQSYDLAVKHYNEAIERREKSVEAVKQAEKTLFDMQFNNKLIDDLRSARAEIRRRLWATVTAAISYYFSRIRQKPTVVTQGAGGFLQNGKSVKGLSGSAKDSLGLAIRAALLKTFIPNTALMVVDEPFAACDDDREVAGIAVLNTLGFPQTMLVTHSDLADAVASQLVQL